jgi:hypothetical protein
MSSGSTGAQDWRAVACLAPTGERLLCVGESSSQVRAAYAGAWGEVIRDEDRPTVRAISLQRWAGQLWAGQWEHQMYLAVPATRTGKGGAAETDEAVATAEVGAELDLDAEADTDSDSEADVDAETDTDDESDEEVGASADKKK